MLLVEAYREGGYLYPMWLRFGLDKNMKNKVDKVDMECGGGKFSSSNYDEESPETLFNQDIFF